jgi:TRAP-type C4-dicarboxylate transport system substrate-binding protein
VKRAIPILLAVALLAPSPSPVVAKTVIKLATFVPDGSVWDKALKRMGEQWKRASDGEVSLRIYAGGVAGDDADVVRKMRIGQLQAGAVTVAGLAEIDPAFNVLAIPLFFDDYDELFHVLDELTPTLERRLREKGFRLLYWGHGGWAHFFSRSPVRTVDDLKRLKIFTWAGDQRMVEWWKRNGFQPVPLAMTDIVTGLQTGMIDALPTPPLAALSLQWFRQTPYMHDLGLAPMVGAVIVTERAWNRIDAETRGALIDSARESETALESEVPRQDEEAVRQMQARGLEVTETADSATWIEVAGRFAESMRGGMVPPEIFDQAVAARDEFRRQRAAAESSP